jgi:hypothetical protein
VARGYAKIVDALEKALMRQNGNRLPKELEAKLAQIVKRAAAQRDRQPLGLEHPEQSTSATVEGERFPSFAAMLAAQGEGHTISPSVKEVAPAAPAEPPAAPVAPPRSIEQQRDYIRVRAAKWMTRARAAMAALAMRGPSRIVTSLWRFGNSVR